MPIQGASRNYYAGTMAERACLLIRKKNGSIQKKDSKLLDAEFLLFVLDKLNLFLLFKVLQTQHCFTKLKPSYIHKDYQESVIDNKFRTLSLFLII